MCMYWENLRNIWPLGLNFVSQKASFPTRFWRKEIPYDVRVFKTGAILLHLLSLGEFCVYITNHLWTTYVYLWIYDHALSFSSSHGFKASRVSKVCTLESGIDVRQGINVGHGKFVKKNKGRALNKRKAWKKCAKLCYKKFIKLENICKPWNKFQNLINVGPLIRL